MTAREVSRLADELGTEVADNAEPLRPAPAPSSPPPPSSSDEVSFQFGDRRWRVRGLRSKPVAGPLRVNLLCTREGGAFHVDTLELYSATKLASDELTVEERVIFDLTNVKNVSGVLSGTGEFANTVTGAELRYIQANRGTFQGNVTFMSGGVPAGVPW